MREFEWIAQAAGLFGGAHAGVLVGIGDDCAVLETGGQLLVSTDTVVDGVHMDRRWMSFDDMGWRALAVALSDLAACGADPKKPITAFLSLLVPDDWPDQALHEFAEGMRACADEFHCAVAGGDTVATPGPFAAALTVLGTTDRPALRRGAQIGDRIAVTGPLGRAATGLFALQHDIAPSAPACVEAYRRPRPLLAQGYPLAASVSAMIDISDGLVADLGHLCRAGGVGAEINLDAIPVDDETMTVLDDFTDDPVVTAITFGDDYQLLCCLPPEKIDEAKQHGIPLTIVGEIIPGDQVRAMRNGQPVAIAAPGYEHGR